MLNEHQMKFLRTVQSKFGSNGLTYLTINDIITSGCYNDTQRKWIIENDLLEGIVAMPDQLFYNTGISTYIWVLSNRKKKKRQGKPADDPYRPWLPVTRCQPRGDQRDGRQRGGPDRDADPLLRTDGRRPDYSQGQPGQPCQRNDH